MNLNPIVLSIPVFFLLIGVELLVERMSHRHLYRLPDSIANLSCGITQQLSGLFLRVLAIGVYEAVFAYGALFHWETQGWLYWTLLFLLVDFAYYWAHRMSHEINLFWGGHVVHHQSEEYNLSVALRQSSFQVVWTFAFNLPLALMGFETQHFALISALNTLYQFWIHTETINKMGWFEWIFNTPSHHRVHHGRNPQYIDKNHAGTLIIWDRMFGTFQKEEERPTYGITKPINSWNAVWANFSHYETMLQEIRTIPRWSDRIKYLFKKPGWLPSYMGGYRAAPEVHRESYHKYNPSYPAAVSYYVLFQYVVCLIGTSFFLFRQAEFSMTQKAIITAVISWMVVQCGVLFERKSWAITAEWIRVLAYPIGGLVIAYFYGAPIWLSVVIISYILVSVPWYFSVTRKLHVG